MQKQSEGPLSLKQQIEFAEQMADPKNKTAEQMMKDDWKVQLESDTKTLSNYQALLDRVHHRIRLNEDHSVSGFGWWTAFQRIAAILIVPLLLSFPVYFYLQSNKQLPVSSFAEIQCPLGVRTMFQLPDGSTGYLNSGSTLRYPVPFVSKREVQLTGEAFFDVIRNTELPFHVYTPNLDIKVLGTTFNVIANDDESTEEVVLQDGEVDVSLQSGKQLAVLKPNEQITLDTEKQTFSKKTVEATQYTSWKEGKLVFRNENMRQVAKRLSRWYNAEVVVDDRKLDDYAFHATFADEPLDEVLRLLSLTTPLVFQEEQRADNSGGVFEKRKIILRIDREKINQFK